MKIVLRDNQTNDVIGVCNIGDAQLPRVDEYITYNGGQYKVQEVLHHMEAVQHIHPPTVELFIDVACEVPDKAEIEPWNGIDEERWVKVRDRLAEIEKDQNKDKG